MDIENKNLEQYQKRITSAMAYIQNHINAPTNDDLYLEKVALAANISPFHFHKIFKSVVGETVADYIRRLKLERAAGLFFYFKESGVTEVAIALGFSSSQNLAKAFKRHFALTPSDIKKLDDIQKLSALIQQHRKNGNAIHNHFAYSNDSHATQLESIEMTTALSPDNKPLINQVNALFIIDLPARSVIYKRLIGEYGDGLQEASFNLQTHSHENNILVSDPVIINWDNPKITEAKKCRTDVCLTLLNPCDKPNPYNTQIIKAHSHAVIRGMFDLSFDYEGTWKKLFNEIFEQGFSPIDAPCYKVMHMETSDPENGLFDISFCQAVTPKKQ